MIIFTEREREVLDLLCQGCDALEIANRLGIGHRTVKVYLAGMYRRFDIVTPVKRVKLIRRFLPAQELSDITIPHLTPKHWAIVRLLSVGEPNSRIAIALGTTEQTVKNHLREIYDRTGSSNRIELTLWFLRSDVRHSEAAESVEVEQREYARVI